MDFGRERIELAGVRQIVSRSQARGIALAIHHARAFMGEGMALEDVLAALADSLDRDGPDVLDTGRTGDLATPRVQDVAAALGRLRSLRIVSG